MTLSRRRVIGAGLAAAASSGRARAQSGGGDVIRIGVLEDMSGPYRDISAGHWAMVHA